MVLHYAYYFYVLIYNSRNWILMVQWLTVLTEMMMCVMHVIIIHVAIRPGRKIMMVWDCEGGDGM